MQKVNVKWLVKVILLAVVIVGLFPTLSTRASVTSGRCGNDVTWEDKDGVLTISGSGDIWDYKEMGNPFYTMGLTVHELVIEEGITGIGDYTFENFKPKSINIPNTVTRIGKGAFLRCGTQDELNIPASVTEIGEDAFVGCDINKITVAEENKVYDSRDDCNAIIETNSNELLVGSGSSTIPQGIIKIGDHAFCTSGLKSIEIPSSVEEISSSAFNSCGKLYSVLVSEKNKVYDSRENCNAVIKTETNELVVGTTMTVMPKTVKSIGDYAFIGRPSYRMNKLDAGKEYYVRYNSGYLELPDDLVSIGNGAFSSSSVNLVQLPNTVKSIGDEAFSYCAFEQITIPSSVSKIGTEAFANCDSLEQIIIPDTVTQIGTGVFAGCDDLTTAKLSKNVEVTDEMFSYCKKLQKVDIPENVTKIGKDAFYNTALKEIALPNSLKEIKSAAFSNSLLETIEIPDNVSKIGEYAFLDTLLSDIVIPRKVTVVEKDTFAQCGNLGTVVLPDEMTNIGASAFEACYNLENINFSKNITEIGERAFYGCKKLNEIELPKTLTGIGERAFESCEKLITVKLKNGNLTIGEYAFRNSGIGELTIYCPKSSYVERYAKNNFLKYQEWNPSVDSDDDSKDESDDKKDNTEKIDDKKENNDNQSTENKTEKTEVVKPDISNAEKQTPANNDVSGLKNTNESLVKGNTIQNGLGDICTIGSVKYCITKQGNDGEVKIQTVNDSKRLIIPTNIVINNVSYNVTDISGKALKKCKKLKKITIQSKTLTQKFFSKKVFKKLGKNIVISVPKSCKKKYAKWLKKAGFKGKVQSK